MVGLSNNHAPSYTKICFLHISFGLALKSLVLCKLRAYYAAHE